MTDRNGRRLDDSTRAGQGTAIFGRRYRVGSILGFELAIDSSWIFIALLITWSLAVGYFPSEYGNLDPALYWVMGVAGAAGLFGSIILHELSHSLVGRRYGVEIRGITLFIFGGVAQMGDEPPTPQAELRMAIAGPIASVVIGASLLGLGRLTAGLAVPVTAVLSFLGYLNFVLAGFNLLPAYPLDGGRVLRAILWRSRNDLRSATRTSSQVGAAFGFVMIMLGVLAVFAGDLVGGMWWALIGMFLRGAARGSYQQVVVKEFLKREPVRRFMRTDPRTVSTDTTLDALVNDYFYRDYHKMYPVVDGGRLAGCVTIDRVRAVPREAWGARTVGDVAVPCTEQNSLQADSDAIAALSLMRRTGISRLVVLDGDRLAGVLTLKDLLQFLTAKIELEGA